MHCSKLNFFIEQLPHCIFILRFNRLYKNYKVNDNTIINITIIQIS